MAGGRPTTYKPEYCEEVIKWGKLGWSLAEMASKLGVDKATVARDWPGKNKEFSVALKIAQTHAEAWYAAQARENIGNHRFNTPLWMRIMASQYKWTDKVEAETTHRFEFDPNKKLSDTELYQAIRDLKG